MIDRFKSGDFLTADRVRAASVMLVGAYALAMIAILATSPDGMRDFRGLPLGSDFFSLWTAGKMAPELGAASAYDPALNYQAQQRLLDDPDPSFQPFLHPPHFLFAAIAFAALPYAAAWLMFSGLTLAGYAAMMKKLAPQNGAMLAILAAPAVLLNLTHGQTGFLIAGLFAAALFYLDRRPMLAGVAIGLLAFKPQYGMFFPLVLLIAGRWRTIFAAALTVAAQAGAATLAFGGAIWPAFLSKAEFARTAIIETGGVKWAANQSLYSALRGFGAPSPAAYAAQIALALLLAATLFRLWRAPIDQRLKSAGLAIAAFLATPYALNYDLILLAPAIALIAGYGLEHGFLPYEKLVLSLAALVPLIALPFAEATTIPIGLMTTLALYATLMARVAPAPARRALTAG